MDDLPVDVLTTVLGRLDGPSLAAAGSSAAFLRRLAAQSHLWKSLCLHSWPSLRLHKTLPCYKSFFHDAYSFPHPLPAAVPPPPLGRLIWAVDLFHDGELLLSRLVETDPEKAWFLTSPLRVHALRRNVPAAISPEKMELSWVVIDPVGNRAASLSSRRPVAVDRIRWGLGEVEARFAAVISGAVAAVAAAVYEEGNLIEVSFTVEDLDGKCLTGRKSLEILHGVLHGGRTRGAAEEARLRYEDFLERKKKRKKEKVREDVRLNMLYFFLSCLFISMVFFKFG